MSAITAKFANVVNPALKRLHFDDRQAMIDLRGKALTRSNVRITSQRRARTKRKGSTFNFGRTFRLATATEYDFVSPETAVGSRLWSMTRVPFRNQNISTNLRSTCSSVVACETIPPPSSK